MGVTKAVLEVTVSHDQIWICLANFILWSGMMSKYFTNTFWLHSLKFLSIHKSWFDTLVMANISSLATETSGLVTIMAPTFLCVVNPYIFSDIMFLQKIILKDLYSYIRKEVNPSFFFVVKDSSQIGKLLNGWQCSKLPYNALQTLKKREHHVCSRID